MGSSAEAGASCSTRFLSPLLSLPHPHHQGCDEVVAWSAVEDSKGRRGYESNQGALCCLCARQGSNLGPTEYQSIALPAELRALGGELYHSKTLVYNIQNAKK